MEGGPVFDASFFREVLPERVTQECQRSPGDVPVVKLHLADGGSLDLCHIVHLAEEWFAVQHFREGTSCEEMDLAFLPYGLVTRVSVSLHNPSAQRLGFSLRARAGPPGTEAKEGRNR